MGMTIVRGDIVSNRISNLNISAGHLYLNGDLTLTQPYNFKAENLHISGGTSITYPPGGSVYFSKIIDPGLNRHSLTYTNGITSRFLDCTRTNNGRCSNSGCTFEQCRNSHEFPGRLECGTRLYCNSSNCNFLSTGGSCNFCVKCVICTPCEKSKIFGSAVTTIDSIKIGNKPPNNQLALLETRKLSVEEVLYTVNSQGVVWWSSNPNVATVEATTGLVTTVGTGTTTITVFSIANPNLSDSVGLTVTNPAPTGVTIKNIPPYSTMEIGGGTWTVYAEVKPAGADQSISWVSTNPTTATINAQGVINAHALGTTVIVASAKNGVSATFTLRVVEQIYHVTIDNYFDQGYVQRSGGLAQARNQIQEAQDLINSAMAARFNLIITSNTPTRYDSLADSCGEPINSQCSHLATGQICDVNTTSYHCKNVWRMAKDYPAGTFPVDTLKIGTWTGHVTCKCWGSTNCVGQNHIPFAGGIAADGIGSNRYIMAPVTGWATPDLRFELALHEISHAFGAVGDAGHGVCITGYTLVNNVWHRQEGEIYNMVINGNTDIYCDKCVNEIKANLLANY